MVLGKVAEIRGVERHQRNPVPKAARGDPGVVLRPGPPAQLGLAGQLAPQLGDPGGPAVTDNLHAYADDNPMSVMDPSGHAPSKSSGLRTGKETMRTPIAAPAARLSL